MIVVTGATGTIGSELVGLLATAGEAVRAVSRRPPEEGAARSGVEWVRADLSDRGLDPVLEGARRLFLLTANSEDMVRLQKNALRAAARAGVPHVVKLSALGASDHSRSVIGLWHYNVERILQAEGPAWTLLRPHHFMQNLLDPVVFDRDAGRVYSPSGEGRIPFIDARDIAAVAARVLTEAGHEEQTYTLTGAEALSYREATLRVGRVIGRELKYVPETMDEGWVRRRQAGQDPWFVAAQLAIAGYQREGGATERTTDTVAKLTGSPARSIEDFARDHAGALRG